VLLCAVRSAAGIVYGYDVQIMLQVLFSSATSISGLFSHNRSPKAAKQLPHTSCLPTTNIGRQNERTNRPCISTKTTKGFASSTTSQSSIYVFSNHAARSKANSNQLRVRDSCHIAPPEAFLKEKNRRTDQVLSLQGGGVAC
jgi:hypothetical protein